MVVMLLTERNELCALRQLHDEVKSRAGKLTILKCDCMRVVVEKCLKLSVALGNGVSAPHSR